MDTGKIKNAVTKVLSDIQGKQGLKCPPLTDAVRPLKDLERFDSPMSIFATGKIGRALGIGIPVGKNIFGDSKGRYTIAQTVTLLAGFANAPAPQKASA